MSLELSNKDDLEVIFEECITNSKLEVEYHKELKERLVESALGLSIMEARRV